MIMQSSRPKYLLMAGCVLLAGWLAQTATAAPPRVRGMAVAPRGAAAPMVMSGPTVRVMPDGIKTPTKHTAYAWAGNPLAVWGNVAWGTSTVGTFVWDFGDGSPTVTGPVGNARDIVALHTYSSASTYYATLTVTDGNSWSSAAQVRIDVLPVADKAATINLAIERGLKYLYLAQDIATGGWSPGSSRTTGAPQTALAVLAFENRGHLPISPGSDIYRDTVVNGLNFALWTINDYRTPPYSDNWADPDIFGSGWRPGS